MYKRVIVKVFNWLLSIKKRVIIKSHALLNKLDQAQLNIPFIN